MTLSCPKLEYDEIPINIKDKTKIQVHINCNTNLIAPVYENETVGNLSVVINGDVIYSLEICNKDYIKKKGIIDYLKLFFNSFNKQLNLKKLF